MSQETSETEFAALLTGLDTSLYFASDTVEPERVVRNQQANGRLFHRIW
jgi:hypothetical protein